MIILQDMQGDRYMQSNALIGTFPRRKKNSNMKHRDRVNNFLSHKPVDRIPFVDWGGNPTFYSYKWENDGIIPKNSDPYFLAGFDGSEGPGTEELIDPNNHEGHLYVPTKGYEQVCFNIYALPPFEVYEWEDKNGYKYRREPRFGGISKRIPPSPCNPLGGLTSEKPPVSNRIEWDDFKRHFNGKDISRYPFEAGNKEINRYMNTLQTVNIGMPGIWSYSMATFDKTKLFELYIDEPDFFEEVLNHYMNYAIDLSIPALEKFNIDTGSIVEMLGYTEGLWVTKDIFKELLLPRYKLMVSVMKQHNIKFVYFDSIGPIDCFIGDLMDIGIDGIYGVPVASGMDVVDLKKEYGKEFILTGGIDRRIISFGSKEDVKKEVEHIIPALNIGGYIPHVDESLLYGASAENYFYYAELIGKIIGVY